MSRRKTLKIRIEDIGETEHEVSFDVDAVEVNARLSSSPPAEFQYDDQVDVDLSVYRSGADLFFQGRWASRLRATCARCLEAYERPADGDLRIVLRPKREGSPGVEDDRSRSRTVLGEYSGDEVDVAPFLCEEMLLTLPTRSLCSEGCQGLCPRCGRNRNRESCSCGDEWIDPRLAVLRSLRVTPGDSPDRRRKR